MKCKHCRGFGREIQVSIYEGKEYVWIDELQPCDECNGTGVWFRSEPYAALGNTLRKKVRMERRAYAWRVEALQMHSFGRRRMEIAEGSSSSIAPKDKP